MLVNVNFAAEFLSETLIMQEKLKPILRSEAKALKALQFPC